MKNKMRQIHESFQTSTYSFRMITSIVWTSNLKYRRFSALLLTICIGIVLVACDEQKNSSAAPGISENSILIGSSSALDGHAAFLGSQYTLGSKAWFNEVNTSGGIHGRSIEFITYDDGYDPDRTVSNTNKLISDDKVFMLFDYVGTPTSVRIIDIVHDAGIPAFGFFTGAEALRTPYRPNIFHVRASYYDEAEGAVEHFVDHLGFSKIAVMYQNDAFGLAVLTGVQLALRKRNLEITATDTFVNGILKELVNGVLEGLDNSTLEELANGVLAGVDNSDALKALADGILAGLDSDTLRDLQLIPICLGKKNER